MNWFQRRIEDRQYRAARFVLLAHYTWSHLDAAQQSAVTATVDRYLKAIGVPVAMTRRRQYIWWIWAIDRAIAMKDLGIPPALPGERWDLPEVASFKNIRMNHFGFIRGLRLWNSAPNVVWNKYRNFRHYGPAYDRARAELMGLGLDVDAVIPDPLNEPHHRIGNRIVTWREWWKSGGGT